LWSNLVSLAVMTVMRYALADMWIWGKPKASPVMAAPTRDVLADARSTDQFTTRVSTAMNQTFHYNIHDIVTVVSEVVLPELTQFSTKTIALSPTIRVRIDTVSWGKDSSEPSVSADDHGFRYDEGFGALGFSASVK